MKECKILGIYFSNEKPPENIEKNWQKRIETLESITKRWSNRDILIFGKIQILKTFGLSLFLFVMRSIGLTPTVLTKINTIFFRFIWKKKFSNTRAFEKVKRIVIQGPIETGGTKNDKHNPNANNHIPGMG